MGARELVVRRRAGLMAVVAAAAAGLAAAYAWRFSQDGSGVALLVAIALGAVAVGHGLACVDARTPLLVADATGLRIRLGAAWTGLPWRSVERVDVTERGRVADGHVVVTVTDVAGELAGSSLRSRIAAGLNRRLYDAPLVVPFGLTTSVSVVDLARSLELLADGRAPVVVLSDTEDKPVPTVEITGPVKRHDAEGFAGPLPPGAGVSRAAGPAGAARREEVTISARTQHATLGGLALSDPADDEDTKALPEMEQLHHRPDLEAVKSNPSGVGDPSAGNVSLIIDATTDLSALAMQRVRGRADGVSASSLSQVAGHLPHDEPADTVLGGGISWARARLGLSVDQVAERTRIRPYVIESIEADDFGPCGGDFYARGHLRMIARVLGLDAAQLVAAYDEVFATSEVNARKVFEVELAAGTGGMVRGGESGANWGALIAAVLVLVLIWGVARYLTDTSAAISGGSPQTTSDAPGSRAAASRTPPPAQPREAHVKVSAQGGAPRVAVTDGSGHQVFAGVLPDGSSKKLTGDAPLRVTTGDGGMVALSVKGHRLGLMGRPGEKAHATVSAHISPASTASPASTDSAPH